MYFNCCLNGIWYLFSPYFRYVHYVYGCVQIESNYQASEAGWLGLVPYHSPSIQYTYKDIPQKQLVKNNIVVRTRMHAKSFRVLWCIRSCFFNSTIEMLVEILMISGIKGEWDREIGRKLEAVLDNLAWLKRTKAIAAGSRGKIMCPNRSKHVTQKLTRLRAELSWCCVRLSRSDQSQLKNQQLAPAV